VIRQSPCAWARQSQPRKWLSRNPERPAMVRGLSDEPTGGVDVDQRLSGLSHQPRSGAQHSGPPRHGVVDDKVGAVLAARLPLVELADDGREGGQNARALSRRCRRPQSLATMVRQLGIAAATDRQRTLATPRRYARHHGSQAKASHAGPRDPGSASRSGWKGGVVQQ
jgi:hypothetical protein